MKQRTKVSLALALAVLILQTGCATIINTPEKRISLSSDPSGATIYVDGNHRGATPMSLDMKRKKSHEVRFRLDGYNERVDTISRSGDGWVLGNIVFGGIIGLVVDLITGSCYDLQPEHLHVELVPVGDEGVTAEAESGER